MQRLKITETKGIIDRITYTLDMMKRRSEFRRQYTPGEHKHDFSR